MSYKYSKESYKDFRERVFGAEYIVWHDAPQLDALKNVNEQDRDHVVQMLTEGVVEHQDHVAIEGWTVFDPAHGLPIVKSQIGKGGSPAFIAGVAKFLKEFDLHETKEDILKRESEVANVVKNSKGFGSLDALISASEFPTREVIEALLERVATADDYLIRYHSANALLKIAGKKKSIADIDLFDLVVSTVENGNEMPNSASDFERYKKASIELRKLIQKSDPSILLK
jgi:hypothetical protein